MRYKLIIVLAVIASAVTACSGKGNGETAKVAVSSQSKTKEQVKGDKKMKVIEMTKEMFKNSVTKCSSNNTNSVTV